MRVLSKLWNAFKIPSLTWSTMFLSSHVSVKRKRRKTARSEGSEMRRRNSSTYDVVQISSDSATCESFS